MNVITQFPVAFEFDRDLHLRAVFEGAAIGIAICQLDGRILETNAALNSMLACSQQELLAMHDNEVPADPPADPGRAAFPAPFSFDPRLLSELIRGERNSFEVEKYYRRKEGSELWGHLAVSIWRGERHQPAFLIAAFSDATERKRVQDHLREVEKMEVIGRLAGGIAHDFNNLLTGILLYCDLLAAGLESRSLQSVKAQPCDLRRHVEEVRRAGEQCAAMTQQLLAIARKQTAEPRPVSLNEIVASTENLLRRLIGEQIELILDLDSGLETTPGAGLVLADPAQLRQVLLNLVLNARDAMPQGGRITVSTHTAEFADAVSAEAGSSRMPVKAGVVSLAVADNGSGMSPEVRARLFEPFLPPRNPVRALDSA